MTTFKKLKFIPYGQAHTEIFDNGAKYLFSYLTMVAHISEDGWLTIYGLYSQTTRKHISAFLREYASAIDYQCAKKCYNDGLKINIHTGEVLPVDE